MKRTRIAVLSCTAVLCFALLVGAIWAAVVATFGINTKLTFNPNGVYVELSGQIYRGESYAELEPLLDDPSYTLEPCKNYTTEEAVDGTSTSTTYSISSWNPEEVLFLPTEKVIQFKLNVTNKGDKQISVVPTNDVTITGVTVSEEASDTLAIPAGETREYRITLTAGTTELKSVPFELGLDMVNTADIENPASDFTMNSTTTTQLDSINTNYKNDAYGQRIVVVPTSLGAKSTIKGTPSSYAFKNLTASTKYLVLPKELETIGEYSMRNKKIFGVSIPESVTTISNSAFYMCTSLTSITIPSGVTSIGDGVFYRCTSLTSITILEGLTSIDSFAFVGCRSLTSITIPSSVTKISIDTFSGCSSLIITVDTANNNYSSVGGSLYNKDKTTLVWHKWQKEVDDIPNTVTSIGGSAFQNCSSLALITIPSSVTSIGNYVFSGCNSLTSITIPNSVTMIGVSAFQGCTSLTSVTLPSSVTSIDGYAFCECTSLVSINIPEGVTRIDDSAFSGCTSLSSIALPSSVTSISYSAFESTPFFNNLSGDSNGLKIVTSNDNPNYKFLFGYVSSVKTEITAEMLSGVCVIADYAFAGLTSLTSIEIPSGVTSIGNYAFYECSSLTTITLPSSVTRIGMYAFLDTPFLNDLSGDSNGLIMIGSDDDPNYNFLLGYTSSIKTDITAEMLSGVCVIADNAFEVCTSLTSITIPSSVTSIGDYAFLECTSLTVVTIDSEDVIVYVSDPYAAEHANLASYATTIYIKSGLSTTSATYLTGNFTKQSSSDKSGYDKWVKNS